MILLQQRFVSPLYCTFPPSIFRCQKLIFFYLSFLRVVSFISFNFFITIFFIPNFATATFINQFSNLNKKKDFIGQSYKFSFQAYKTFEMLRIYKAITNRRITGNIEKCLRRLVRLLARPSSHQYYTEDRPLKQLHNFLLQLLYSS